MKHHKVQTSPQVYARIGGILYLVIIVAGLYGEAFSRGRLIVSGDPAATAHNIISHPLLYRSGIAFDLIMHICDIPVMIVFYLLLKPVSKSLAQLGTAFNLTQTAILGINKLTLVAVLSLLRDAPYMKTLDPHQLQTFAYLLLGLHEYGFGIGLIFFGCRCLVFGYLIFKSGYFPKGLGIGQSIAGGCYLINSFALILFPTLADLLFPYILIPAFFAELAMALWLLIKGVNLHKWNSV